MNCQQFLLDMYARLAAELELVVTGLTVEELNFRPKSHSNSIGWLAWHVARSQDRMNAGLFGEEQLWIRDRWHAAFDREPDPKDTGNCHTLEQLAGFRSQDAETIMRYYRAVLQRTQEYVTTRLSEADLQREVVSPSLRTTNTVEERLLGTINNFQHVGQAGYVRGLLEGIGWCGR